MRTPERGQVERGLGAGTSRSAEPPPQLAVVEEPAESLCQGRLVSGLNEDARLAVDDELRKPADARRDNGQLRRHRLEHGYRQALGPTREHEDVGPGEELRDVAALAGQLDAVLEPEPLDLAFDLALGRGRRRRSEPRTPGRPARRARGSASGSPSAPSAGRLRSAAAWPGRGANGERRPRRPRCESPRCARRCTCLPRAPRRARSRRRRSSRSSAGPSAGPRRGTGGKPGRSTRRRPNRGR